MIFFRVFRKRPAKSNKLKFSAVKEIEGDAD